MRAAKNKATLKNHILQPVTPREASGGTVVADGGALLWCCNWKRNEMFSRIFQKYIVKCQYLRINVVVFDRYASSTKDATHKSRSAKVSQVVQIHDDNLCPCDRTEFLSSYVNKKSFIDCLGKKSEENGFQVVYCPGNADTTIIKTALNVVDRPVTILADDTDILCLLLYHVYFHNDCQDIFLKTMRTLKDTQERISYSINDIIEACNKVHIKYILFAHTFTGCDTTSIIHKFGKTSILSKLKNSCELQQIADQFCLEDMDCQDIGSAAVRVFELLNSPTCTLQQIRRQKYDAMVAADRSKIDPALLPPSPRAAFYHGLRVYHQIQVWKALCDTDIEPLSWG